MIDMAAPFCFIWSEILKYPYYD